MGTQEYIATEIFSLLCLCIQAVEYFRVRYIEVKNTVSNPHVVNHEKTVLAISKAVPV